MKSLLLRLQKFHCSGLLLLLLHLNPLSILGLLRDTPLQSFRIILKPLDTGIQTSFYLLIIRKLQLFCNRLILRFLLFQILLQHPDIISDLFHVCIQIIHILCKLSDTADTNQINLML